MQDFTCPPVSSRRVRSIRTKAGSSSLLVLIKSSNSLKSMERRRSSDFSISIGYRHAVEIPVLMVSF